MVAAVIRAEGLAMHQTATKSKTLSSNPPMNKNRIGVILKAPMEELYKSIDTNEKLWGNTWLGEPVQAKHPDSYRKFKKLAGYRGYGVTQSMCSNRLETKEGKGAVYLKISCRYRVH